MSLISFLGRLKLTSTIPFSVVSRLSTVVSNIQEAQENEEPDKLYKTIEIEMRSYEPATPKSYVTFATSAAQHLGITVGNCWAPKKPYHDRRNLTILKSVFVHKNHRVQYEVRTYYRYMTFHNLTGSTADTFLEYIERNLPEGIALKITKVAVEKIPEEFSLPPQLDNNEEHETDSSQVKDN